MILAGVDAGSRTTKAVLWDEDHHAVLASGLIDQGIDQCELARSLVERLLRETGRSLADVRATIALARLLREKQPRLFAWGLEMRDRFQVERILSVQAPSPLVLTSGLIPASRGCTTLVLALAEICRRLDHADYFPAYEMLLDDLREQFKADAVELKLFSAENLEQAVNQRQAVPMLFDDFMKKGKPRCGALKREQLQYLFGSLAAETGSVALIPLTHKHVEGVLAIGSRDPQRFHPGKDTEFLQRLGDLVSHALGRIKPLEKE